MDNRIGCVMKMDIWSKIKEGSEDFVPFIEVESKIEVNILPEYKRIMLEKKLGIGKLWWMEHNTKKQLKFQCDCWTWVEEKGCFRLSTIKEAQELFEQKQRECSGYLVHKEQNKKNKKPVFTLVQSQDFGCYVLLDRETNSIEGDFKLLCKPSNYPQYAKLIAGMQLFAKVKCSLFH